MSTISHQDKNWYALYTKPRHEFKAVQELRNQTIENFLPTVIKTRKWSDRVKKIEMPLFNGYIFIYADEKERLCAVQQSSIVKVVSFSGKPAIIPEWQIENIRKILAQKPDVFVLDGIEPGTQIKIAEGPFAGVTGVVKSVSNEQWLFVAIDLLNRTVQVKLPKEEAIKITGL